MKAILITGSSQGIGRGIAEYYAANGFHVFVNYLSRTDLANKVVSGIVALGGSASAEQADVRNEDQVRGLYTSIEATGHNLKTVVINATDEIPKPIDLATFDEWHQVLSPSLTALF
jgi:NAD(P)-dependent dehydrogenase (short-subunit alcohol dehydrogenase family)